MTLKKEICMSQRLNLPKSFRRHLFMSKECSCSESYEGKILPIEF